MLPINYVTVTMTRTQLHILRENCNNPFKLFWDTLHFCETARLFTFLTFSAMACPLLRALMRVRVATMDLLTDEAILRGTSPNGFESCMWLARQVRYAGSKVYWEFITWNKKLSELNFKNRELMII